MNRSPRLSWLLTDDTSPSTADDRDRVQLNLSMNNPESVHLYPFWSVPPSHVTAMSVSCFHEHAPIVDTFSSNFSERRGRYTIEPTIGDSLMLLLCRVNGHQTVDSYFDLQPISCRFGFSSTVEEEDTPSLSTKVSEPSAVLFARNVESAIEDSRSEDDVIDIVFRFFSTELSARRFTACRHALALLGRLRLATPIAVMALVTTYPGRHRLAPERNEFYSLVRRKASAEGIDPRDDRYLERLA